jgi:hypothetical protein
MKNNSPNVFIGIDYDTAYKAVIITEPGGAEKRFETGDPVADFRSAVIHGQGLIEDRKAITFMTLSSLDGFIFDVPGWRFNEDDMLEVDPNDQVGEPS